MSGEPRHLVVHFICPDRSGILAALTACLYEQRCDIRDVAHFGDPESGLFFLRMDVLAPGAGADQVAAALTALCQRQGITVRLHDMTQRPRILIAVSQHGHCLNDLLHRWQLGVLPADIVGVVSNHPVLRGIVEWYGVPFHHLPVSNENRPAQEQAILDMLEAQRVELLVLARYMQVLSERVCSTLVGRCVNIHHSFLPGFKGAKPYHSAHARGVKLIGATAHYVTTDLDEGPIIEQDVRRVTHATAPEEMIGLGREIEASVLSRAVRWHVERRIILNGQKTVVFN